jgi:hypothetical protein
MTQCSWPGCSRQSDQPYTDGWCSYGGDWQNEVPGLPHEGWLCPTHNRALDALEEQSPSESEH